MMLIQRLLLLCALVLHNTGKSASAEKEFEKADKEYNRLIKLGSASTGADWDNLLENLRKLDKNTQISADEYLYQVLCNVQSDQKSNNQN